MALPDKDNPMTAENLEELLRRYSPPSKRDAIFGGGFVDHWPKHVSNAMLYGMSEQKVSQQAQARANKDNRFAPQNMRRQIASRLGYDEGALTPFRELVATALNEEQAVVFLIVGGKAITLYDDLNLFPSDALVTQLRLLEE